MNRSFALCTRFALAVACALSLAAPAPALAATAAVTDTVKTGPASTFNKRPPLRIRIPGTGGVDAAGVSAAAAAIADMPGTPIPSSPVTATLDAASDRSDVWSIALAKGDRIGVTLTPPASADFSPELWSPGTTSIGSATPLTGSYIGTGVEHFDYVAPTAGTYFISAYAWDGAGQYTLAYSITPGAPDDTAPGVSLAENAAMVDAVTSATDPDDVWSIACVPGRHYYLRLVPGAATVGSIDAALFAPGAVDVLAERPLQYTLRTGNGEKTLRWGIPAGGAAGTYSVDVRAIGGGGSYTIQYWSLPNTAYSDLPGGPLPGSFFYAPLTFSGNWDSAYGITLKTGQRLTVRVDGSTADAFPYLLAPGTPRLTGSTPIAKAEVFGFPRIFTYTVPAAGTYLLNIFAVAGVGSAPVTIKVAPNAPVTRVSGGTRYTGAVTTARAAFPGWSGVKHVVLVTGDDAYGSDPLVAAGLCGVYDAPMLLVRRASMAPEALAALKQLPKGVQVHVVGSPYAVSETLLRTVRSLKNVASVERVTPGNDRYSVAANVARRIVEVRRAQGLGDPPAVLVANGAEPVKYFDALALGPVAFRNKLPILLVGSNFVPAPTAAALSEVAYTDVIISGGPATVNTSLEAPMKVTKRWWGADRYSTAADVAAGAIDMGWAQPSYLGLAAKIPDALTGATLMGRQGGLMLVTKTTSVPAPTGDYLFAIRKQVGQAYVFGGPASVTEGTRVAIYNKINK